MSKIKSFGPIIDDDCIILILGSIPGVESLRKNEYYGHKRNAFWRILYDLMGEKYEDDYALRTQFLLNNHIAVWDVIEGCYRHGSLDSNIKDEKPNDFEGLYKKYPNINYVFFNGSKAYETYRRKVGFDTQRMYEKLPSTSPAHAISYEKKLKSWEIIKERLQNKRG